MREKYYSLVEKVRLISELIGRKAIKAAMKMGYRKLSKALAAIMAAASGVAKTEIP